MIKNYFKIAVRNLVKNKLYTSVNIIGLTIGITSCILIGIYIIDELSFDRFHKNSDRIARVTMDYQSGNSPSEIASTGTKVGPQFKRTFPEVEAYVRTLKYSQVVGFGDKVFEEKNFLYADSAFFKMFSFHLLSGDATTALNSPDKIVLTQSAAKKYFGTEDPIGKTVKVGDSKEFIVSGVAADAQGNSQIKFDFVASFNTLNAAKTENWWEANYITYLLLNNKESLQPLQKRISSYMQQVSRKELQMEGSNYLTYHLEPLTKVHLYSKLDGFEPNNNIVYIWILAAVAFLIMLIACVNYTNLSTAQSATRSAEIGVRKVLGANKSQLFNQFISESFIFTVLAVVLGILLSLLLLPHFNQLSGKSLTIELLFKPQTMLSLLILTVVVSIFAGGYPAIVLSNVKIINILKSGFSFTSSGGGLRKSLIVLQFVISLFLITATIVILKQLSYIKHKDLGYNKEQVVVLPLDRKMRDQYDDLKKSNC